MSKLGERMAYDLVEITAYISNLSTTGLLTALILAFVSAAITMRRVRYQAQLAYENTSRLEREKAELAESLEDYKSLHAKALEQGKAEWALELEQTRAQHARELEDLRAAKSAELEQIKAEQRMRGDAHAALVNMFLQFVSAVQLEWLRADEHIHTDRIGHRDEAHRRLHAIIYRTRNKARALLEAKMPDSELFDDFLNAAAELDVLYYEVIGVVDAVRARQCAHAFRRSADDIVAQVKLARGLYDKGKLRAARFHLATVRRDYWPMLDSHCSDALPLLCVAITPKRRAS
jgi:hypothetical protein